MAQPSVESLLNDIVKVGRTLNQLYSEIRSEHGKWQPMRQKTIDFLEDKAKEIDIHHRGANIFNAGGSSVAAIGGGMALAGAVLAPITFGASLGLTIAGGVVGLAGGATSVGATFVDCAWLRRSNQASVEHAREEDRKGTCKLDETFKKIEDEGDEVEKIYTKIVEYRFIQEHTKQRLELSETNRLSRAVAGIKAFIEEKDKGIRGYVKECINEAMKAISKLPGLSYLRRHFHLVLTGFGGAIRSTTSVATGVVAGIAAHTTAEGATTVGRVLAYVGVSLAGVGIALDVVNLAIVSVDIYKGSKTEAAQKIREAVTILRNEKEYVDEVCQHVKD